VIVTVVMPAPVHSSVAAELAGSCPANPNADVCVPSPAKLRLAVFILTGEVVQLVPSYNSVAPVLVPGAGLPPKAIAAV
jgi:hypothetical protein